MKRSPLTEGIIFSIDVLLEAGFDAAAKRLAEICSITVEPGNADQCDRQTLFSAELMDGTLFKSIVIKTRSKVTAQKTAARVFKKQRFNLTRCGANKFEAVVKVRPK